MEFGGGAFHKNGLQRGACQKFACSKGGHPKIYEHLGNFAATIDVQQTYMTICFPPPPEIGFHISIKFESF